jgi:NAD-dependent dihydropyrimidine dehydrogenase PreA subunit
MQRKIIEIDESLCNGCGACVTGCAEGALAVIDGKARIVADHFCDGLGACLGHCPTGALRIIERDAPEFDEAAAMAHVATLGKTPAHSGGGCPSTRVESLAPHTPCQQLNIPAAQPVSAASALGTWPIKLRLVPPNAPFLQGARLLLTSDCVPPAFPAFHWAFLPGRVVLLGCPKFDDTAAYVEKLAATVRAMPSSISVLHRKFPAALACPALPPWP